MLGKTVWLPLRRALLRALDHVPLTVKFTFGADDLALLVRNGTFLEGSRMCGIVGYLDLRSGASADRQVLKSLTDALVHRGPDSSGYFIEGSVGLGFRRLSIIDLKTGNQPILSEDENLVLTCNGEIYDYPELKSELISVGHTFRTRTDVEVLLHLYENHGDQCLQKVNGQFAFAIYDRKKRSLFLARDQFGICPLYYTVAGGVFIYASEIKAILKHPLVSPNVDLTGLDQVLSLPGPISPRTVFKDIKSLVPGHFLLVKDGQITTSEYWDLDYPEQVDGRDEKPERFFAEELRELFQQSVKYRLQADVPVGIFLSGGLDSSMIAAMIQRVSPEVQRHSFSISFSDQRICESRYQRLMSTAVGSIHHEIPFNELDIADGLRDVVYHAECPLKETYNTASLALSRRTRENGVTVVLNGEGSDELFAGYVGYRFDKRRACNGKGRELETILGDEIRDKLWGDPDLYYEKDEYTFRETKTTLYSVELSEHLDEFDCANFPVINKQKLRGRHPVHKRSYLDFKLRLAGHLIADHGDRMAMASSIEARYPFLDINLVEFCRQIPPGLKLNGYIEKAILKKAAEGLIPQAIIEREKFGFVAPGSPLLLQQKIGWLGDLLSYERIKKQGYFNPGAVESLKARYSQTAFTLNPALEDDLLIIVITFGLLQERFGFPDLN
jgi:asparagine synthase (glutamine-hydrolysing)